MLENIMLSQYTNDIDNCYSKWQACDMTKYDWL